MQQIEITRKVAAKVLAVVDAGLVKPRPGQMCVEWLDLAPLQEVA